MKRLSLVILLGLALSSYGISSLWGQDTMTIILKDGKRQTFNAADVVRIEFQKSQVSSGLEAKYKAVLVPEGITWEDANRAAQAMGGHLAAITSAAENEYVYSLIAKDDRFWSWDGNGLGPWLGGYQTPGSPEPGGGWKWVTGEPFGYANWASGEPNDYNGREDRIQFFGPATSKSPKWNDTNRNDRMKGYIVEFTGSR